MEIDLERRMLYIPVLHIDTNLINARQKLDAVNMLEKWADDEVILINMSSTAYVEAKAGNNASRTRKANQQIFTITDESDESDDLFKKVEAAFSPGGAKDENQKNDVRVVCEACKYAAILVTNDGGSKSQPDGILGNRDKLRGIVQIISPDETVAFVKSKIQERDDLNRQVAKEFGKVLPDWTGKD